MNVLIIYPHWHPANLAGVHRPRLIGNYLPDFGWNPIVLTVQEKYYEKPPDPDFYRAFADHFEVHRVQALPVTRPRIIGDIGLRAFFSLKKAALKLLKTKSIDFIWIPIPSFYVANLGAILYNKFNIPYCIDYIDPWIRDISNRKNLRAIMSQAIARFLEPRALKKASLVTGVDYGYYKNALYRNFSADQIVDINDVPLHDEGKHFTLPQRMNSVNDSKAVNSAIKFTGVNTIFHGAMPYGFDPDDHRITLENVAAPWKNTDEVYLYAGAFLPNSAYFIRLLFLALREIISGNGKYQNQKLYFVGTGNYTHKSIESYAQEAQVSEYVTEIRGRYPFLQVLNFLSRASGVMVIGSTEEHYTASKVYQALMSKRPVFAVFHRNSSAAKVMRECKADQYLVRYSEDVTENDFYEQLKDTFLAFLHNKYEWQPDLNALEKYSARESARILAKGMQIASLANRKKE